MSNPIFLTAATFAVLLSLVFVVLPLIGGRQRAVIAGLVVAVPAATLGIYALVGTPEGIDPSTGETGEIRTAVTDLARQAMRDSDNAENWARLGLAYKSLEEFGSAEHAFRRALYINNDEPFIQAELAETLLYASDNRELSDEARRLLENAADSGSQKAVWLLGLEAFQKGDHERAAERFERLLALLPPDSGARETVEQYLGMARSGGHPPVPSVGSPRNPDPEGAPAQEPQGSASLSLNIGIRPELADRLSGGETVFVAVRRAGGGPPLAVRRLQAADLPTRLQIDDSDAMMAGNGLSSADSVVAVARVSFSGSATPAAGDFEGRTDILPVDQSEIRAEITIDQIL